MDKIILEQAGLSKGEAEIYLILLKIGEASASEIAKYAKIARPNIYDYLNKLKDKGLITFLSKKNKIYYISASPEKIIDYVDEKKYIIERAMPGLLSVYREKKKKSKLEVYEGIAGFKGLMNEVIKDGNNFVGWGGSDQVRKYVPEYVIERYLKLRKKKRILGKMLLVEQGGRLETSLTEFKEIPREYSTSSTTIIYGNKVGIMIYTTIPVIIIIESEKLSDSYRKHFGLLWKSSRKTSLSPK